MNARELKVAVISDLHLATHASKPKKILKYLKSIHPETLVLNGDIIDSWRFTRSYFPKLHLKVVRQLIKMMEKGVKIFYITGNHDEFLRKFTPTSIGNLKIVNQLILELDGAKTWIFHGDIFDNVIHRAKWLAKFLAASYGLLSMLNKLVNNILRLFGKGEVLIYTSIRKKLTKKNKLDLTKFEKEIGNAALAQDYQYVICGHTHVPKQKDISLGGKTVHYFNSGDWVGNFTATEYYDNEWHMYYHHGTDEDSITEDADIPEQKQIYKSLVKELIYPNVL